MSFNTGMGSDMPPRPKKRRNPLPETYIFQLGIDLAEAQPPIWRRIEIRSDVNLWTLHRVIQGAFGWFDAHLYRFSLGHPYSGESELFLCDVEVSDGETEGTFAGDVRVDETLQQSGDQLEYLYDYGDDWHLKIKLENVRPALPDDPIAVCTDGQRAAPPEDSGGMVDAEFLAEFIDDPAFFDPYATNELIGSWLETPPGFAPAAAVSKADSDLQSQLLRFPQFKHILDYCYEDETRAEIARRLQQLEKPANDETDRQEPDETELHESLSTVQLLLNEIGDGVKLTGAGYLPPKIALRVGEELELPEFLRSTTGESKMLQVMEFRAAVQHVGLLRKHKGDLLPTKAGKDAREAPKKLWNHLAKRLLPREPSAGRTFSHDAALLSLLFAATSDGDLDLETIADLMTESGWRVNNDAVRRYHVVFEGSWQVVLLWYMAPKDQRLWFNEKLSPAATELARAALLGMKPAKP